MSSAVARVAQDRPNSPAHRNRPVAIVQGDHQGHGSSSSCRVFEDQFVSSVNPDYLCAICGGIDLHCVRAGCGNNHLFCACCLSSWLERSSLCPLCQTQISGDDTAPPPEACRREIFGIRVRCTCATFEGRFSDLPVHLLRCPLRRFPCRYRRFGCPIDCHEDALRNHEKEGVSGHLSLVCAAFMKLEEKERRSRAEVETLKQSVHRLSDILGRVAPMEFALAFGEALPKLFALGHPKGAQRSPPALQNGGGGTGPGAEGGAAEGEGDTRPLSTLLKPNSFGAASLDSWNFDKRVWTTLCDLPLSDSNWTNFSVLSLPSDSGPPSFILAGGRLPADSPALVRLSPDVLPQVVGGGGGRLRSAGGMRGGGAVGGATGGSSGASSSQQRPATSAGRAAFTFGRRNGKEKSGNGTQNLPSGTSGQEWDGGVGVQTAVRGVWQYRVKGNTWDRLEPFCVPRADTRLVVLKGHLCAFGGFTPEGLPISSMEVCKLDKKGPWSIFGLPPLVGAVTDAVAHYGRAFVLHRPLEAFAAAGSVGGPGGCIGGGSSEAFKVRGVKGRWGGWGRGSVGGESGGGSGRRPSTAAPGCASASASLSASSSSGLNHSGVSLGGGGAGAEGEGGGPNALVMHLYGTGASSGEGGGGNGRGGRMFPHPAGLLSEPVRSGLDDPKFAAVCHSFDPLEGLQEEGKGWKKVQLAPCLDVLSLGVVDGRLYALTIQIDESSGEICEGLQMFSIDSEDFGGLSRASCVTVAPRLRNRAACGLPLEGRLSWLSSVGGERGQKRLAVWM